MTGVLHLILVIPLMLYIDFTKALQKVDKLEYYGIRGVAQQWFISYLSKKSKYVQIGDICSNYLHLTCGVPQGSILGPLLCLCILMIL